MPMKKAIFWGTLLCALLILISCDDSCRHRDLRVIVEDPTCSLEGYTLHVCEACGYSYKSDILAPEGHEMTHVTTAPTCEEQGFTEYRCVNCDYTYTADHVTPLGHEWRERVSSPDCEKEGYTEYSCEVCQTSFRTDHVAPKGHTLARKTVAPTCTAEGYTTYSCACGYSYISDRKKPTGHTFASETVRPNYGQTGYTSYTCSCGYSYVGDYVWYSDIFSGAAGDGEGILAYGIDLSHHNESVDWQALRASGIDFVILRVGTSRTDDRRFEEYYAAAKAVGLDVGCYYYTYATTVEEALADAERMLTFIRGKTFEYPVYYDMEDSSQLEVDPMLLTEICLTFSRKMVDAGFFPGLYTNWNWLTNYLNAERITTLCDVWYAQWRPGIAPDLDYSEAYGLWQYSDSGTVEGVKGKVDVNVAYKDYPSIMKEHHYNGY